MTKINKPRLQYTSIKKAAFDAVQYIDDRRKGLINKWFPKNKAKKINL